MAVIKPDDDSGSADAAKPRKSTEHDRLCSIAYKWLINAKGCAFAFSELVTYSHETPDAIGFKNSGVSFLVECKATRSDFLSDKKKWFRREPSQGMGTYRFYMCPEGLISPDELPDRWGLIYVKPNGKARQVRGPKGNICTKDCPYVFNEKNDRAETTMMMSALRRLHLRGVMPLIYQGVIAA